MARDHGPITKRTHLGAATPRHAPSSARLPLSPPLAAPAQRSRVGLHLSERRLLLLLGDLVILSLALGAALWLRRAALVGAFRNLGRTFQVMPHWWAVLGGLWICLAMVFQCYDLRRSAQAVRSAVYTAAAAGVTAGLYLLVPYVSAPLVYSRLSWFLFAAFAIVGVAGWRILYAGVFHQPTFCRRVLVVGAGRSGRSVARAVETVGQDAGIDLVGLVDDDPTLAGADIGGYPLLGASGDLEGLVAERQIDEIVVAITDPASMSKELVDCLVRCWGHGTSIVPMPLFYEQITGALPIEHLGQNLFALAEGSGHAARRIWQVIRRLIDIALAAMGLLVLLPLLPIIALAIRLDSPGPVFYRQQRVGLRGRPFDIVKLRSMIPNAEPNGAVWARSDDRRITRVGRLMRRMRLDELPQLWNLLRGDMTLIGPRPERPEFVRQLVAEIPYYGVRHSIKPGLTGWAQVQFTYGSSIEDAWRKLEYDLYYVKHRGPVLDLTILLKTIRVVLQMKGT
jgi:exopolysaccharide biosynthesis polyprenyl glycosylphosphotransferase